MSAEEPMWRLVRDPTSHRRHELLNVYQTYSPAPESGIRSTLHPESPIYQTNPDSEDEDYTSAPNSPPHSSQAASPVDDLEVYYTESDSDTATPTPGPVPLPPNAGPSRILLKIPARDTKMSLKCRRESSTVTDDSSQSQDLDLDTMPPLRRSYVLDENGQKRYPCLRCDKQFGRSHDRKRHMEESTSCRGGPKKEPEPEAVSMWVCERCGDSFSRRDSMNRHKRNPDACKVYKRLR